MRPVLWAALVLLVIAHLALVAANAAAFVVLPFLAPWYIAVPLMSFVWFFATNNVRCLWTEAENNIRKRLGLREVRGFIGHYTLKPAAFLWRKVRSRHSSRRQSPHPPF